MEFTIINHEVALCPSNDFDKQMLLELLVGKLQPFKVAPLVFSLFVVQEDTANPAKYTLIEDLRGRLSLNTLGSDWQSWSETMYPAYVALQGESRPLEIGRIGLYLVYVQAERTEVRWQLLKAMGSCRLLSGEVACLGNDLPAIEVPRQSYLAYTALRS